MSSKSQSHVVPASTQSVLILAANETRQGFTVQNTSTAVLYLKWNGAPSATDHSVRMPPDSYYEVPFNFTGAVFGIWSAINGQAIVTEVP